MKLGLMLAAAAGALAQGEPEPKAEDVSRPSPASASAAGGTIAYPASFFAASRPSDAFEMLQRAPGFTFTETDVEVRGFAGAGGNVLIDGVRPTAKSVTLEDLLRRIPAASVVRIELIRGGAPGIDMQGQPLVANIVRSRTASASTAVTTGLRVFGDGWIGPQADLEWSRRAGLLSLEGALHATWEMDPESGQGRQTRRTPSGTVIETGPLAHRERGRTLEGAASAELDRGADVFRLNLGAENQHEGTRETVDADDAAGRFLGRELVTERRIDRSVEAGGDYEHTFSDRLSAKVVALQTLGRQSSRERSEEPGQIETSDEFGKTGESILRASLTARRSSTLTIEAGGEGAFNVLDAKSAVTENGAEIVLPNANVRVEERRAEAFATAFWKPTARISLEAGARVEASRISQSGDAELSRSFFFPKPRLVAAYAPDQASQLRIRVEREVGQLDFADFAATAELGAGSVTAGNAELEPERSWVFEVTAERRFWGKGALVLTYTHAEVQQVVDLIPIDGRFDAPGNIGDGRRDQLKLTGTLPLDRLGVSGGLLTGEVVRRWSKVTDPTTGQARRITLERPFEGQIHFSQDVARLRSTWGVDGQFGFTETEHRISEVRRMEYQTYWTLFWDWKPRTDLSIRGEVQNIGSRDFRRIRTLFDGPRSAGVMDLVERRNARFDPFFYLRMRKAL